MNSKLYLCYWHSIKSFNNFGDKLKYSTNSNSNFKNNLNLKETPNSLEEILVGIILGDAWLEKQKTNARLRFEQSHIRTDFFFMFFKYFSFYSTNTPYLRERVDKRTGKIYKTWHFSTLSLPFFKEYYNLFYKDIKTNGIIQKRKVIPDNI